MKAFSLFFILLSSIVRSDIDLEKGRCGMWKRIGGVTVDRGGYGVPFADSLEACQLQCYLFKTYCELITWTAGRSPGCQHVLPNSRVNWINDTASTAFWLQGDTDCDVDCPNAFKAWTNWKFKDEYAVTTGDRTLKGCKARCLRNTDCIAFDLCPGDQCHFQIGGNENDKNKSKDCLYVALKRPGCKEKAVPSRSKSLRASGSQCAQFTSQKYTRGASIGSVQPHILNEDACQDVCATFRECVATDWLSAEKNGIKGCVFYDFVAPSLTSEGTSTHYTMINRGNCPVDCIHAFRAIFDKRSTLKLTSSEYITTLYGCMEECVGQKSCFAIEWRDPSTIPRCWLQLDQKTDFYETFQKDYVIYQIGRPWCKETTKRTLKTKSTRTTTTTTTTEEPTTKETRERGETLSMLTDPPEDTTTITTTKDAFTKPTRTIFKSTVNGQELILTNVKEVPETTSTKSKGNKTTMILIIISSTAAAVLLIGLMVTYIRRAKMEDKTPNVTEEKKKLLEPAKLSAKAKIDEKIKPKMEKIKRKLVSIGRPDVTGKKKKKTKTVPKK